MVIVPPRVHFVSTEWLGSVLAKSAPDFVIDGYPEYGTDVAKLDVKQRDTVYRAASLIVRSFGDLTHVSAVLIRGHADTAHKVASVDRARFERDISRQRATAAAAALRKEMNRLSENAHFTKVLPFRVEGVGSTKKLVQLAQTETQMRQNRRVEITLGYSCEPSPNCGT